MAPFFVGPVYLWITEYKSLAGDSQLGSLGKRLCGLSLGLEEDDQPLSNYPKTGCNPRKIQDLRAFSDSYLVFTLQEIKV